MRLTQDDIKERLRDLNYYSYGQIEWQVDNNGLSTTIIFNDFRQAFAFMTQVAMAAEKIQHHPTWSNTYHRVSIHLTTHDVGGISALDFQLAREISSIKSAR